MVTRDLGGVGWDSEIHVSWCPEQSRLNEVGCHTEDPRGM